MSDLFTALALIFVIEGTLYALIPEKMIGVHTEASRMPPKILRRIGLVAMVLGSIGVWLVRAF
ncbi:MAG: DUF2065 domain-containing protein [Pseudomonadota bacterium]|nr:DUF2065 domain-containing protein [Pseudomonadota bacterium]